jgi:hypothetical protein
MILIKIIREFLEEYRLNKELKKRIETLYKELGLKY